MKKIAEVVFTGPDEHKTIIYDFSLVVDKEKMKLLDEKIKELNKKFCLQFQFKQCILCKKLGCLVGYRNKEAMYLCPEHIYSMLSDISEDDSRGKIYRSDKQPEINVKIGKCTICGKNIIREIFKRKNRISEHGLVIDTLEKYGRDLGYKVIREFSIGRGKSFGRIDVVLRKGKILFGFEVENDKISEMKIKMDSNKLRMLGKGVIVLTSFHERLNKEFLNSLLEENSKEIKILK